MNIRHAGPTDAAVLARLGAHVQDLHHRNRPDWFKPADPEAAIPLYCGLLVDPTITAYLAEEGPGESLGYLVARTVERPETALTWGARIVDIDQIGVAPTARRRGVGAALIRSARQLADSVGADRLHLTVWGFNEDAQVFFRAQGLHFTMRRMTDP
jgi:ribosomal protein S18 acetylase RimI-like enzyme